MGAVWPADLDRLDFVVLAVLMGTESEDQGGWLLREVAAAGSDFGGLIPAIRAAEGDAGADGAWIARRAMEFHGGDFVFRGMLVLEDDPAVVDADDEIGPTVFVDVGGDETLGVAGDDEAASAGERA